MYSIVRPLLFALPPEAAHDLAFAALTPAEHLRWARDLLGSQGRRRLEPSVATRVMGLDFPSVVGLAAGFDKNARRPRCLAALGFGHLEVGTVTAHAQAANPRPNLFRLRADRALVNRLGFPNEGAARVAARLRAAKQDLTVPVGVSIGKSRCIAIDDLAAVVDDYVAAFEAVRDVADFVVVNVSSPNTAGLRSMQAREHAFALLSAIRRRPGPRARLLVKIAPDLMEGQLEEVLSVADEVGLDGVVATNTTVTRRGLSTEAKRVEAIGAGGLSGPPLRARAVEMVRRVRARLGRRVVVVGVGGVEEAEDVLALVRAGADLVQMYTGFVYGGPWSAIRIGWDLARLVEREGATTVADLVGALP